MNPMNPCYNFAASDFSFYWEANPYAFYEKHAYGIKRPFNGQATMPLLTLIKANLLKTNLRDLGANMPDAFVKEMDVFLRGDKQAHNKIHYRINGRADLLLEFADGTHGLAMVKALDSDGLNVAARRQLNALAFAAHTDHAFTLHPSKIGLLTVKPLLFQTETTQIRCETSWEEREVDLDTFKHLLFQKVFPFLEGEAPEPDPADPYWDYVNSYHATEESSTHG